MNVVCPDCGQPMRIVADKSARTGYRGVGHDACAKGVSTPTKGTTRPAVAGNPETPAARKWSAATPTMCGAGHRHASKMESRVCDRLTAECTRSGWILIQQVRFPLVRIAPKDTGRAHSITVDFVIVFGGGWRAVDAKARRRISRDWPLRAAAFQTTYGVEVEEVSA